MWCGVWGYPPSALRYLIKGFNWTPLHEDLPQEILPAEKIHTKDKDKKDKILRWSSSHHVYTCTIEINNQIFKNTLGVLAFLPGEGDLVLVYCLINDWHPRKFFTGSQESSSGPKPFQCTRYSTLPFLVLLPRIRSTYKINMWIQLQTYSVNLLITCILCYTPGPAVWLSVASYAASDHRCHNYLCPTLPEIAVAFLVESYEFVLERCSYVFYIKFINRALSPFNLIFRLIPPVYMFWHF